MARLGIQNLGNLIRKIYKILKKFVQYIHIHMLASTRASFSQHSSFMSQFEMSSENYSLMSTSKNTILRNFSMADIFFLLSEFLPESAAKELIFFLT